MVILYEFKLLYWLKEDYEIINYLPCAILLHSKDEYNKSVTIWIIACIATSSQMCIQFFRSNLIAETSLLWIVFFYLLSSSQDYILLAFWQVHRRLLHQRKLVPFLNILNCWLLKAKPNYFANVKTKWKVSIFNRDINLMMVEEFFPIFLQHLSGNYIVLPLTKIGLFSALRGLASIWL